MPLLVLPLLVLALLLLWLLLLPIGLVLRYRSGRARQRAFGWVVNANAWLLLGSAGLYLATAWGSSRWVPLALSWVALGLLAGMLLGVAGVWRTRFETSPAGFHYTPDRWLVLLLTGVVALRIGLAMWQGMARLRSSGSLDWFVDAGSLFAVGGLLLGYHLTFAWGLRRRWRRWRSVVHVSGDESSR
ncbi:MAG: DUF1453 domain-containing protein [Pseudomonadota bacterium]|nr:DUF1453 domain-containing protein [Pseudomonadota bacterium]